jgi:hypothetical protein
MNDETYCFVSDIKEKRQAARSAHNRKTHRGKGGMKMSYEYMSKKELAKMSGEVKTFNLNEPMLWKEFKLMPDDLQITYIKSLWSRFDAPLKSIAAMMGCGYSTIANKTAALGLKAHNRGFHTWDEAGFWAWIDSGETEVKAEPVADTLDTPRPLVMLPVKELVPDCGELHFCGNANEILQSLCSILGGKTVGLTVSWELIGEEVTGRGGREVGEAHD